MDRKIKICGLRRACDIDYINEAKPDYVGFVFAKSPRRVSSQEALFLKERMVPGIQAAGVFVNEQPENIIALVKSGIIDVVQLHGQETYSYVNQIKQQIHCPVIKAISIKNIHWEPLKAGEINYQTENIYDQYVKVGVDYFLFDSSSRTKPGGTGRTFDWNRIPQIPYPFFLAGGLDLDNIESALRQVDSYGVDISSGVETGGVKDRDKILEMIRRIRNV